MTGYVFDSFALLAYYWDEAGAARVEEIIAGAGYGRWMTVVNLGEVYYKAARRAGQDQGKRVGNDLLRRVLRLPIELVDADRALTLEAARIKADFPLAYADCFAAALARRADARVITGDPEFAQLEEAGIIDVEWLGGRRRRGSR